MKFTIGKIQRVKDGRREQIAFTSRVFTIFLLLTGLLSVLLVRMLWLMVVQHEEYATLSDDNRIHIVALPAPRGLIYDRHGELLADIRTIFSVVVVPELVADLEATLSELASLLALSDEDMEAFRARLAQKTRPLQAIAVKHNINAVERASVEVNRHRLAGVDVRPETVRYYPFKTVMAHAVGSVRRISKDDLAKLDERRYRATQFIGKRGVEAFYESSLHGEPGMRKVELNAHGVEQREVSKQPPRSGQSLTLHLDSRLQIAASAALGQRRGAVVAIDPKSGGILAMVSHPGYDPNAFVTGLSSEQYALLVESRDAPLLDRAAQGQYAPGSTIKPVVGMAGLALKLTDWERTIVDRGEFRLPNQRRVYRDWSWQPGNAGGQGIVDLRRAIYRSSNVYFYELGSRMATDQLPDFAAQFGYGRIASLDVFDAQPGILPDGEWKVAHKGEVWYPGDTVNLSIGQGDLLVTPLQLATVAAVIANRGKLVPPRMLKSSDGALSEFARGEPSLVEGVTEQDWENLVDAMEDVVHRGNQGYRQNGTAWAYIGRDIRYRMAGKSGTAQVVEIPQGEEYDEELLDEYQRKHAWFIAFAPADEPQLALAVLVENGGGGSSVAAPVAREVMDAYLLPRQDEADRQLAAANAAIVQPPQADAGQAPRLADDDPAAERPRLALAGRREP